MTNSLGRRSTLLFAYLEKWAIDTPGKIALIECETGQQLMYRQLLQRVEDIAHGLLHSGIRPGDRIVVSMPLSNDFVALLFACFRVGAVCCPLPSGISAPQLAPLIHKLKPSLFIYELSSDSQQNIVLMQTMPALASSLVRIQRESKGESLHPGSLAWSQWLSPARLARIRLQHRLSGRLRNADQKLHASSPALICLSGPGNTQPVVLCYENILAQRTWLDTRTRLCRSDKVLTIGPGAGLHTLIHSLIVPLTLGASALLVQQWDPEAAVKALHEHCISFLIQPASNYRSMLHSKSFEAYSIHTLRWAILTDRPPVASWMGRLRQFAPKAGAGWSLPEAGGFIAFSTQALRSDNLSLPGGPVTGQTHVLSVRAARDCEGAAGPELPENHVGEVCLQSPQVFSGYFADSEGTRERISREGILYTGLQGYIRSVEEGEILFLLDTKSEQLQQMRQRWLEQGLIHPIMAPSGLRWQPMQA